MTVSFDITSSVGISNYDEIRALSRVVFVLSQVFGYPSVEEAEDLVSPESPSYIEELLRAAAVPTLSLEGVKEAFLAEAGRGEGESMASPEGTSEINVRSQAVKLRQDITRLFQSPDSSLRLEGDKWMPVSARCPEAQRVGERICVRNEYARQGLRMRSGVTQQEHSLQNELEFVSVLIAREAEALFREDVVEAARMRDVRREFYRWHLRAFIAGVTDLISRESGNSFMAYYAHVLQLVAVRIGE